MTGHYWLDGLPAALMVVVAAFSAVRLAVSKLRAHAADVGADGLHVLMGIAMAGMFDPRLSPVPGAAWQAVFAASAVWFAWQAARRRLHARVVVHGIWHGSREHPVPHAVESVVMFYMLLPAPARPGGHGSVMAMPGMATAGSGVRNPALALVLALFLLGYILWTTDGLAARRPGGSGDDQPAARPPLAPRLSACTKIAMSAAMGYMLLMTV